MGLPPDSARQAHGRRLEPAPLHATFHATHHDRERRVLAAVPESRDEETRGVRMPLAHARIQPTPP